MVGRHSFSSASALSRDKPSVAVSFRLPSQPCQNPDLDMPAALTHAVAPPAVKNGVSLARYPSTGGGGASAAGGEGD